MSRRAPRAESADSSRIEWASLSWLIWPEKSRILRELQDEMSEWRVARAVLGGGELPGEVLCKIMIDRMRERHDKKEFRILLCMAAFPLRSSREEGPAMKLLEKW